MRVMRMPNPFDRRQVFGLGGAAMVAALSQHAAAETTREGRLVFNVSQFGATGNGKDKDTAAIQKAVDASFDARGGLVYFPPGDYLSGSIRLKSNVTLYLDAGATIWGSRDLADYNSRSLIYAEDATRIAVMGPGRIDGNGGAFWRKKTPEELEQYYPLIIEGGRVAQHFMQALRRPGPMLAFHRCTDVRIYDVLLTTSPLYTVHPVACDSVFIRGVTIRNPLEGPNLDGIDPDGCTNVMISDCNVSTADDAICIKNFERIGPPRVSRNITVTNCVVETTCNALKVDEGRGEAGFENIVFSNSVLYCAPAPDERRTISGIHIDAGYGCTRLSGISISNISMRDVRSAIFIRSHAYAGRGGDALPGKIRDIMIDNVYVTGLTLTSAITGLPGDDVEGVSISNLEVSTKERGGSELVNKEVPELPNHYPEVSMFRRLPSYGLYCRHVKGLKLRNVNFKLEEPDMRPALLCDDVKDLDIAGLTGGAPGNEQPLVRLIGTKRAFVHGCYAPPGTTTFLRVEGGETGKVTLLGNDLSEAASAVTKAADVAVDAVFESGNRLPKV
jgi:hypothetical protein